MVLSNGHKIAGVAALVCLLGSFLPWVVADVIIVNLTINGWQATFGLNVMGNYVGGNFLLILVLLAPFAAGYLVVRAFLKGGALDRNLDAYGLMGLGVVVVLLLITVSGKLGSGISPFASLGFGWILCLLAGIAMVAGGFLNYWQLRKRA